MQASITSLTAINLKTKNVTRLSLQFPLDQQVLSRTEPVAVTIDGAQVVIEPPTSGQPLLANIEKSTGQWKLVKEFDKRAAIKRPGLQGPIDDAFLDAFVFVGPGPTGDKTSQVDKWIADEFAHATTQWRRHYRGDVIQKPANQITQQDIADKNLILFGTPETNPLIGDVMISLRRWVDWNKTVTIGSTSADAASHVPVMIYPNPLNPARYVVINSGFTFREFAYLNNARQIAMLPDWAIVDVTTGRNFQMPGKVTAAGFFDENWLPK